MLQNNQKIKKASRLADRVHHFIVEL